MDLFELKELAKQDAKEHRYVYICSKPQYKECGNIYCYKRIPHRHFEFHNNRNDRKCPAGVRKCIKIKNPYNYKDYTTAEDDIKIWLQSNHRKL